MRLKMGRLGIITLHYGWNEGSMLQAFALAKRMGAEVIDHRYLSKVHAYGPAETPRLRGLARFLEEQLPRSPRTFISDDEVETTQFIQERYSHLIFGSDELWKFRFHQGRQTHLLCTPVPNLYLPDVALACKKAAFAASIGASNPEDLPPHLAQELGRRLACFEIIGVRDAFTRNFVRQSLNWCREIYSVPDPVWGMELAKWVDDAQLHEKLRSIGVRTGQGLLVVAGGGPAIWQEAERWHRGRQILSMDQFVAGAIFAGGVEWSPLEWGRIMGLAEVVVCSRMHPVICALSQGAMVRVVAPRPKTVELLRDFGIHQDHPEEQWPRIQIQKKVRAYQGLLDNYTSRLLQLGFR